MAAYDTCPLTTPPLNVKWPTCSPINSHKIDPTPEKTREDDDANLPGELCTWPNSMN